ncbi:biopolymer transporter ExbD [Undibacterium sp. LX40W]|uniref:Biopolymer transporter ExbD n=1 Tax=Undibacterium nitidum TaxID=2762298 RepID=A0A923HN64_9BURK|nr:biopolymer transporter ExbD [Undibacterium nitidum]MBC3882670.1 biopolymer transporter ExbD [Undibacterium nitidum]MBC3892951.1 biopolymer transporter ExbD [Undibacterium sp. LX40W]
MDTHRKYWQSSQPIDASPSKLSIVLLLSLLLSIAGVVFLNKSAPTSSQNKLIVLNIPGCTLGGFNWSTETAPERVKIDIDFDGRYMLNGKEIEFQDLQKHLQGLGKNRSYNYIEFETNQLASFGKFHQVLNLIQSEGINSVGIVLRSPYS